MPATIQNSHDGAASPARSTSRPGNRLRTVAAGLFVLFSAWLLLPALFSAHVEAFSARLQSMAIMDLRGQFARDDLAYPIDIEYFYTTRGGTIHVLEWIMRLTHSTGDLNFRILIWLSFAVFVGSCVVFMRRWSEEPVWAALVVLVLAPGLSEIAFFFADNLPSAALVTFALALIGRRTHVLTWFAAGAALACGVLLRIDAIVAVPSLLLLALIAVPMSPRGRLGQLLAAWVASLAGITAVLVWYWKATTISLWQCLQIGRIHNAIHAQWGDRPSVGRIIVLFFGPTALLVVLGALRAWRLQAWPWRLALIAWPALFYATFLFKAVELRDYLLLGAPYVLLLGAIGLRMLLHALEDGPSRQRLLARLAVAGYAVSLLLPPMILLQDGPRLVVGRAYAPIQWRRWQRNTETAQQQLRQLASTVQPGEHVLMLSTLFQSDRYLHLVLLENGYALEPTTGPTCAGVETYTLGGRNVFHIRTENPYFLLSAAPLRLPPEYVRAYQLNAGLECLPASSYDRAYMLTWGRMGQGWLEDTPEFLRPAGPMEMPFPNWGTRHIGKYKFLQIQRVLPLDAVQLTDLQIRAKAQMADPSVVPAESQGWQRPRSFAEFRAQAEPLVWKFKGTK